MPKVYFIEGQVIVSCPCIATWQLIYKIKDPSQFRIVNHILVLHNTSVVPRAAWGLGDPHFTTLDGKNYTFNGLGEYIMMDAKDDQYHFQFQARTAVAPGSDRGTIFAAMAVKESDASVVEGRLLPGGTKQCIIIFLRCLLDIFVFHSSNTKLCNSCLTEIHNR